MYILLLNSYRKKVYNLIMNKINLSEKKIVQTIFVSAMFIFVSLIISQKTEVAKADVPEATCPAGSMRLSYADGSTSPYSSGPSGGGGAAPADPWANPPPAPVDPAINWDDYLDQKIIDRYNRLQQKGVNLQFKLPNVIEKAYAQYSLPANWQTQAGPLAYVVYQEQGGGPFCKPANQNSIYAGLMDNSCTSQPGTQLAGFQIVAIYTNFACGVPSPVTDG